MAICPKVSMHFERARIGRKKPQQLPLFQELSNNFLATQYPFTIYLHKANNNNMLGERATHPYAICCRTGKGVSDTTTVD